MLLRKSILCLCVAIVLPGLLACSSKPAQSSELTDDEVRALIQNDIQVILDHLDSLVKTNYGKNYLADLLEKDLELSCELVWYENGKEAGVPPFLVPPRMRDFLAIATVARHDCLPNGLSPV